jgi:acetolactate synthase-1/2/3 large subunit
MYTIQALWSQAREGLNVTNVIFDNGSYAILNIELGRVGADAGGPAARSMLEIGRPDIDFVAISTGMGVPAERATTADEFTKALATAFEEPGPHLIQAVLPRGGL